MRFGPRKRAAAGVAVLVVVALVALVVTGVLALDTALVLVAAGVVLVAVAFADVRASRRARRLHQEVQVQTSTVRREMQQRLAGLEGASIGQLVQRQETAVTRASREQQERFRHVAEDTLRTVTARLSHLDAALAAGGTAGTERLLQRVDRLRTELRRAADHDVRAIEAAIGLQGAIGDHPLPPMGNWAASADLLGYLYRHVLVNRPSLVVECGSGVSTVVVASAMARIGHGRVISYDHEERYAERTRELLAARGLSDRVEVCHAPLVPTVIGDRTFDWYDLDPSAVPGPIDVLVVDGPPGVTGPEARAPAVPRFLDQLASDAVVVLDDAEREDEAATFAHWAELLPDHRTEILRHRKGTGVLFPPARRHTTVDLD